MTLWEKTKTEPKKLEELEPIDEVQLAATFIFDPSREKEVISMLAGELEDYYRLVNSVLDEPSFDVRQLRIHRLRSCAVQFGFPKLVRLIDDCDLTTPQAEITPILKHLRALSSLLRDRL